MEHPNDNKQINMKNQEPECDDVRIQSERVLRQFVESMQQEHEFQSMLKNQEPEFNDTYRQIGQLLRQIGDSIDEDYEINFLDQLKEYYCPPSSRELLLGSPHCELLKAIARVNFQQQNKVKKELYEFLKTTMSTESDLSSNKAKQDIRTLLYRSLNLTFDVHDTAVCTAQLAQCVCEWADWSVTRTQCLLATANGVNMNTASRWLSYISTGGIYALAQYVLLNSVIEFNQTVVLALHDPLSITQSYDWPEALSLLLSDSSIMGECMTLLNHDVEKFMRITCERRGVLFNKFTNCWIETLLNYVKTTETSIQSEIINRLQHYILTSRQDGHTVCFTIREGSSLISVFEGTAELCKLLRVRDDSGNTALHSNTHIFAMLMSCYQQHALENTQFNQLLSIQNDLQQRSIDLWPEQSWLMHQINLNNYALYEKPELLILYNATGRPGAEEEAQKVTAGFQSLEFEPKIEKDLSKTDIHRLITESASRTKSALVVIVMTHGFVGSVTDVNGELIKLSEMEMSMSQTKHPKVLITQCCQIDGNMRGQSVQSTARFDPAGRAAVSRPVFSPRHDDVCVIESCVQGQYSKRDFFIRILSDNLKQLRNDESITDLFEKTTLKMKEEGSEQIPVIKSTMRRKLCLKNVYQK